MSRPKSTDSPEAKALRKLLKLLGLTPPAINALLVQMTGRLTDLSSKACDIQLYLAAHPEVANPAAYAAVTLRNYALQVTAPTIELQRPITVSGEPLPATMELWGDDD